MTVTTINVRSKSFPGGCQRGRRYGGASGSYASKKLSRKRCVNFLKNRDVEGDIEIWGTQ